MLKKHLIVVLLIFTTGFLSAQTFQVNGQYLDKKNNPISNALVSYFASTDLLLDSIKSQQNGNFELTLDLTSINTHAQNNDPFIKLPAPNPFNGLCSFTINISAKATVLVTDMRGLMVDKHEIKNQGVYSCSWGGQNRIGQQVSTGTYNVTVVTGEQKKTHKVIFNGNSSQRIKSEKISNNDNLKSNGRDQDRINFLKTNTSELDIFINPLSGDTTLGVIIGNTGPESLNQIITTVHIESTNTWNLNDYFYNDDQSVYTTTNSNFTVSNDSIMTYVGSDIGTFTFDINATDPQDGTLTTQTQAQITVTNEQIFSCSGYYLDKYQQPIADATITYWEGGSIFAAQTTSTGSGYWSMDVATSGTNQDKIEFVKANTTELEIFFTTPSADTTFGDIIGNIGPEAINNINETHFTIDGIINWNLNNQFTNDDQSNYTLTGNDYSIVQDTMLELSTQTVGTFLTTVTATDPQDATLTAQITADVEVEYTINLPDTAIIEDYPGDTLFTNLNQYINPNYQQGLTYAIASQSNSTLIDLQIQDSLVLINNLQADSAGSSYVGIEITGNNDVDTVYFTVTVDAMPDVSGYITDIFDTLNVGIAGVVVEITLDSTVFYYDTTDANGYYSIQLPAATQTEYYFVVITKAGYTSFHTWADTNSGSVTEDYTIIPSTFVWDLYNVGFRSIEGLGGTGFPSNYYQTTRHWLTPPPIHLYSDNSIVGGNDITEQYNNLVYNTNNILPTFNPRDALPSNIVEHTLFSQHTLQDGDMGAYFDDSIYPAAGVVARIYDGPKMNRCSTAYYHIIGETGGPAPGADNWVFNQELGSCFGSVAEPPQSSNYDSVFKTPTSFSTYTSDDYDCSTVMLDRARVHYKNLTVSGENSYDWEMRPDEILTWYPGTSKSSNQVLDYKIIGFNGEIIEKGAYPIDEVPSRVMKMAKIIFTPEQIANQERKEARLDFKLKKWFKDNTRKAYTYSPKQEAKALSKREIRKIKREKRRIDREKRRNK